MIWRVISCSRYGCIDVGPSPGDPWGPVSSPSRRAGGNVTAWLFFRRRDHRHVRLPGPGPHLGPADRGEDLMPGAFAPKPGPVDAGLLHCSSSPGKPPTCGGRCRSPALVAWLFGERYEFRPPWGVTRRCLPGGMSRRGDRSPEGATGQAGGRCQGIRPSCRARATASVRLAAPSLPRTWVTCFLTVSSATTRS
jgi:hypothetical protein